MLLCMLGLGRRSTFGGSDGAGRRGCGGGARVRAAAMRRRSQEVQFGGRRVEAGEMLDDGRTDDGNWARRLSTVSFTRSATTKVYAFNSAEALYQAKRSVADRSRWTEGHWWGVWIGGERRLGAMLLKF